jgi:hypothetical protein
MKIKKTYKSKDDQPHKPIGLPDVVKKPLSKQGKREDDIKQKWWEYNERQLTESVFNVALRIENNQRSMWRANVGWAQLYENLDTLGYMPNFFAPIFGTIPPSATMGNRLTYNIIKSCVDSVTAKIAKNKPRAKFITTDGSFKTKRKSKKLTQYLDGLFYGADVYNHAQRMFKNACVFGTGCMKVFINPSTTDIKVENILPTEIIVDQADGVYGKPKQLFQRKNANRDNLLGIFPEHVELINSCASLPHTVLSATDQVMLIEAWHLPSKPGADDGKHAICLENVCLFEEPWTKDYFPFVFYRWTQKLAGFYGMGLCEELAGIQLSINKLLKMVQAAQEYMCVPRVFMEAGSNVAKQKVFDMGIIEYAAGSAPPIFNTAPAMPPEIYSFLDTLFKKAYEISGVSQLSASAQKPAGLNSGVALREYQDINTERFAIQGDRYEQLFLELGKMMIDLTKELYEDNPDLSIKSKNKKFVETIKWSDVDLKEDQFTMECFPVSSLPETPEGRLQFVQELAQAGLIEPENIMELMSIPDVEGFLNLKNSSYEDTMKILDDMIDNGKYERPDPYMNLQLARTLAQGLYLKCSTTDLEQDRLDLLRQFMDDCDILMQQAEEQNNQPPPPPEQMQPGSPQGVPEQPPVSDLMPSNPM